MPLVKGEVPPPEVADIDEKGETGPFSEGETVLAYHGEVTYEAKVLAAEIRDKEWKYLIHYKGWNKSWDEWLGKARLLKHSPENLRKRKELIQMSNGSKTPNGSKAPNDSKTPNGSKTPTGSKTPNSSKTPNGSKAPKSNRAKDAKEVKGGGKEEAKSSGGKSKKRKSDAMAKVAKQEEQEEEGGEGEEEEAEQQIKIPLPESLKRQLVDDWRFITQEGRLMALPRHPNVADILDKYLKSKSKSMLKDNNEYEKTVELVSGLRDYFERALPAMLLYKQERQQQRKVMGTSSPSLSSKPPTTSPAAAAAAHPSRVYGAEHLLRLFTKLPELLSYVNMEEGSMNHLLQNLVEFLKFMQKNQSTFFLSQYDGPLVPIDDDDIEASADEGVDS